MDKEFQNKYLDLEQSHWWFKGRREIIFDLIRNRSRKESLLDIGASGGALLSFLKEKGFENLHGVDISDQAVEKCRERGFDTAVVADARRLPYEDSFFDIIIASDVLEHIEDEKLVLREWRRVLKPKGILILFVPAFKFLWGRHDEINHHYRRYSKKRFYQLLENGGLKILRISYWNFFLFAPVLLMRVGFRFMPARPQKDDLALPGFLFNSIFFFVLQWENKMLHMFNFPFGVSLFGICEKDE